jgi:ketosteroid isomerase-like protein
MAFGLSHALKFGMLALVVQRVRRIWVWALVGFVLACAKSRSSDPATKPGRLDDSTVGLRSGTSVASASANAKVSPPSEPALTEGSARALFERWLEAQNQGDFAAYERLYAERFTGVKRSGDYKATFDRKGWLRDRKGMFTHAMRVEASQVALSVTPRTARVTLQQTWSAGTYRDVGPKQMVLVATADGPRIAREEMLSSTIAGAEARAAFSDLKLVSAEGLILDANPADGWASGQSRPGSSENVALRAVNEASLPAALRSWKGRSVRVLSESGRSCEAKVSGFLLRAEVVPHFGSVKNWHGDMGAKALRQAEIAEEVWTMASSGGRVLVGMLEPSACDGAWALDAARTPPQIAAAEPADAALSERALRALRALPEYPKIQKEFEQTAETPKGRWEDYLDHKARVTAFRFSGKLALVEVMLSAGNGCGDFSGTLTALYGVRKGTQSELEYLGPGGTLPPSSAFDLDGDGSLEVLFGGTRDGAGAALWRKTPSGSSFDLLFVVPFLDCGC